MHVNKGTPTMPAVSVAAGCCLAATPANEVVVVEDIFGLVQVLNDGTVVRSPVGPVFPRTTFPENHPSVEWKEAVYDKPNNLLVRMYKPSSPAGGTGNGKVPVLVHFHGGGFCIGSPTWGNVHAFCLRLAADTGAVVLSAGYRLAPEHRLPAAVDDGAAFMDWLRAQSANAAEADAWLTEAADFNRVFVTGDSAGATIAHHLAVRAGAGVAVSADDAAAEAGEADQVQVQGQVTMTIRGYVLMLPFFGGVERTPSEQAECPAGALLSLDVLDRFWRVSLPAGTTRDHPVANPFGPDSPDLGAVEFVVPVLVVVAGLDLLRDRAVEYVERLAAMGKPVELVEFAGLAHGFFLHEPGSESTGELIRAVGRFVDSCVVSASEPAGGEDRGHPPCPLATVTTPRWPRLSSVPRMGETWTCCPE